MSLFRPFLRLLAGAKSSGAYLLLLGVILVLGVAPRLSPAAMKQQGTTSPVGSGPPQGQNPLTANPELEPTPSPLTSKQQKELLKASYNKMKQEVDELAALTKSLQEEINKSNQNILSLRIVDKADKIEKLAKKIKSDATH